MYCRLTLIYLVTTCWSSCLGMSEIHSVAEDFGPHFEWDFDFDSEAFRAEFGPDFDEGTFPNTEPTQFGTNPVYNTDDPNSIDSVASSECRRTEFEVYNGTRATSVSGYKCNSWWATTPHKSTRIDPEEYPAAIHIKENFCRNTDREYGVGPWCYTPNPAVRYDSCGIPWCGDCRKSTLGTEYRGAVSITVSGRTCQRWDSKTPHNQNFAKFDNADENYCRNFAKGNRKSPWCFTTDPNKKWEYCNVPYCAGDLDDCKRTRYGSDYNGVRSTTISGLTCQRWDAQSPHKHVMNDVSKYPNSVNNKENYCRNPNDDSKGPWCYTTDQNKRWEYCLVPLCLREISDCKKTTKGAEYRGTRSVTISGRSCQRWDSQTPHKHAHQGLDENYCRNPNNRVAGPWCYTTDPARQWEYCDIPDCSVCRNGAFGFDYKGKVSRTISGRRCQRWDSQIPHKHERNNADLFPNAVNNEENYCRNPDGDLGGPWCYTMDPKARYETCGIPICRDETPAPVAPSTKLCG